MNDLKPVYKADTLDLAELRLDELLILGRYVFQAIADLVNDAGLDFGLGKYQVNGFSKAVQVINAGNQDVLYAAILKIRDSIQKSV